MKQQFCPRNHLITVVMNAIEKCPETLRGERHWIFETGHYDFSTFICLTFNQPEPFHFRWFNSLLFRDCRVISQRCSCDQPSMKRRFVSFAEQKKMLHFFQYFNEFLNEGGFIFLSWFGCLKCQLQACNTMATSGDIGFHHRKLSWNDLLLMDCGACAPVHGTCVT